MRTYLPPVTAAEAQQVEHPVAEQKVVLPGIYALQRDASKWRVPEPGFLFILVGLFLLVRYTRWGMFWFKMLYYGAMLLVVPVAAVPLALLFRFLGRPSEANFWGVWLFYHLTRPVLGVRFRVIGDVDGLESRAGTAPSSPATEPRHRSPSFASSHLATNLAPLASSSGSSSSGNATTGPRVIISNHQAVLDIFCMCAMWRRHWTPVVKESFKWIPFLGIFVRVANVILLRRTDRDKAIEKLREAGREMRERGVSIHYSCGSESAVGQAVLPIACTRLKSGGLTAASSPSKVSIQCGCLGVESTDGTNVRIVLSPMDTSRYSEHTVDELMAECHRKMLSALHEIHTQPDHPVISNSGGSLGTTELEDREQEEPVGDRVPVSAVDSPELFVSVERRRSHLEESRSPVKTSASPVQSPSQVRVRKVVQQWTSSRAAMPATQMQDPPNSPPPQPQPTPRS